MQLSLYQFYLNTEIKFDIVIKNNGNKQETLFDSD